MPSTRSSVSVSYTHLRAHETEADLVCRLLLEKNNVEWIPLKYTKRPPIFSTIWDIYKPRKAINKLKNKGLHLIHCRSYITTLVALGFKKKYKTPFIFDMRGFYTDERVDGKIWTLDNFIYKKSIIILNLSLIHI